MAVTQRQRERRRVAVTGAAGFVGGVVAAGFRVAGWDVLGLDREGTRGCKVLDLSAPYAAAALRDLPLPDAVVHLAARVHFSEGSRELYGPNVLATAVIAEWAREAGAHLTFASTITVCGARVERAALETPAAPDTPYGVTKWVGAQVVGCADGPHAVLRLAGVFGRGGPTHLGLNRALADAAAGRAPRLVGEGRARRNYVYVEDVARVVVHAAESRLGGTHVVGGGDVLTVEEMLDAVCDVLAPGLRPAREPGPEAADQIAVHSPALPASRTFREALFDMGGPR
jgi:nucleoside-diphosphate-sugar epimerase